MSELDEATTFPGWVNEGANRAPDSREMTRREFLKRAVEPTIWLVGAYIISSPLLNTDELLAKPNISDVDNVRSPEFSNLFEMTGLEIKEMLKAQAIRGESGRLAGSQLVEIGERWGSLRLYPDAAVSMAMMSEVFRSKFGHHIEIGNTYRTYAQQVATKERWRKKGRPHMAATPGNSVHGWGLAADLGDQDLSNRERALSVGQEEHEFLEEIMSEFGWTSPDWAKKASKFEPWHKEYVGKPNMNLLRRLGYI